MVDEGYVHILFYEQLLQKSISRPFLINREIWVRLERAGNAVLSHVTGVGFKTFMDLLLVCFLLL
jgi:hypothetical protein